MKVKEQVCVPDKHAPDTSFSVKVDDRVELHPATDRWMMGDKYGTVVKLDGVYVHVRLDVSGKTRWFHPNNIGKKL